MKQGITIHTQAVGADADRNLMRAIAYAGGGIFIDVPGGGTADMMQQLQEAFSQIAAKAPPALFLDKCSSCHAIRGTSATAHVGPDLTHVGSRTTIAALTLPMDTQGLTAWLRDPQHVKPGNRMPNLDLSDADIKSLVAYLESLK